LFTPTGNALCTGGSIDANYTSLLSTECQLVWAGGLISVVNESETDCTWYATSPTSGTFTYALSESDRRK
jgi:hypothetical protein